MAQGYGTHDDTPSAITTVTLMYGRAGTLAALQTMPTDTDPAVRRAYQRLYRAFGAALHQRIDTRIIDIPALRLTRA